MSIFQEGHVSTIKTLLELGADLHVQDKKGRTGKHLFRQHFCVQHFYDISEHVQCIVF